MMVSPPAAAPGAGAAARQFGTGPRGRVARGPRSPSGRGGRPDPVRRQARPGIKPPAAVRFSPATAAPGAGAGDGRGDPI